MKRPLRYVGYIKPMDKMTVIQDKEKRIAAIDVEVQKESILNFANINNITIAEVYEDAENEDFSSDEAFTKLRNDAIYRKFDVLILDSVFCFGMQTYIMTDILMNVFFPAGIHFVVIEDDFRSYERTLDEVREYCKRASQRYRSRQALITVLMPDRKRVVQKKYVRRNERPPCILKMLPEYSKTAYKRGKGHLSFENEEVQKQLRRLVLSERKRAEYAISKLKEAEPFKNKIVSGYLYQTDLLWKQMTVLNEAFVDLHYQFQKGLISETEYIEKHKEYMKRCEEIEEQYARYRAEIFEIETLFDTENRWIKRFTGTPLPDKFNINNIVRWIQGFDVKNGIVTNVVFTFWEWRDALPDICTLTEE